MKDSIYHNAEKNIEYQNYIGDIYNIIIYVLTLFIFILPAKQECILAFIIGILYTIFCTKFGILSWIYTLFKKKINFNKKTTEKINILNKHIGTINPVVVSLSIIFNFETFKKGCVFFIPFSIIFLFFILDTIISKEQVEKF